MLIRLAVPLLLWALFVLAICLFDRITGRHAEQPADEPERPAEQPDTEPPEDVLLAA